MKIIINDKEFSKEEMDSFKKKRAKKVLHNLKKTIPLTDNTDILCESLAAIKYSMSYEEIVSYIKIKLAVGRIGMKLAAALSGNKRSHAITTIFADGITAESFSKIIDSLMLQNTVEHQQVNLAACPDHYALIPHDDILEVIETTGNMPVPTQFFISFYEETGIQEPRDMSYPYHSTGIAKLKDGTIIGGVRHQFRDTQTGIEVRTLVEFPGICPKMIIKEHQKHLAVEWSSWLAFAMKRESKLPL